MDIAPQCVEGRLSVRANPSTPETKAPRTSFGGRSPLASTSRSQPNSSPITSRAATQGISPAELGHGTGLALSTQPVARGALAPRRGMYVAERENTRVAFHAGLSSAMGDCHVSPAGEILGERGTGRESVYRSIASEDFSGWSLEDHPPSVALTQPSTAMQWGNVSPRVDGCLPSSTNSAVAQNQDIIRAPHLWTRVASVGSTMSVPTFGSPSHERISTQLLQEGERGRGARSSGDRAPSTLSSSPSVLLSLQRDLNATIQLASELLPIHAQGCDANHQDMVSLSDRAAGDEQILRELIRMRQQFSTEATLIAEAESYYDRLDAVERQLAGTLVEIDATASTVDEIPGGTQRFTADFDLCAMLVSRLEQLEDDLEPIEDLHDRMLQSALVNREVDSNLPRLAASSQCAESELVIGALRTVEAAAARLATELSHRRASIRDALLREVRFLASQESKAEASVQAYIAEHDRQRLLDATDLRRPRQHFYYFGSERDGESSGGLTMSLAPPLLVVNDGPNEHGLAEADDLTSEGFTKGDLPSALPITVVGSSARHAQLQLCECTCQRIDAIVGRLRSLLQGRQCDLRSLDQQLRQMDAYDPSADALSSRRSQLLVAMDPLQMWQEQMRTIKTRAYAVRQSARAALETAASRRREVLHSVETVTESAAEPCTSEEMQEEDLPPPGVDALPLRAQQHSSAFSQLLRRFVGGWRTRSAALEMSNNIRFPPNMIAIPEEEEGTSCSLLTSQHVVDLEPTISRKRPREILHDASNSVSPRPSCQTRVDRSSSEASKCAESGSEDVPELIPPQRPTPSTREQAGVEKEAWVSEGDSEAVVPEEYSLRNGRLLYGIGALVKSIVRRALTFGDEEEDEPEELMSPPSVRRRVELEFAHT